MDSSEQLSDVENLLTERCHFQNKEWRPEFRVLIPGAFCWQFWLYSPKQKRESFVVGALENFLFFPAFNSLDPFFARTTPVFRDERHFNDCLRFNQLATRDPRGCHCSFASFPGGGKREQLKTQPRSRSEELTPPFRGRWSFEYDWVWLPVTTSQLDSTRLSWRNQSHGFVSLTSLSISCAPRKLISQYLNYSFRHLRGLQASWHFFIN